MPAGYVRVWLSMEAPIGHVMGIAGCGRQEARDALVQAVLDGEIRSRFGDNGLQEIKAFLWQHARQWAPYSGFGARMPNRVRINGEAAYLRPYFDPPPDPALLPERMRPVEVRREEVEQFWVPPTALQDASGPPAAEDTVIGKDNDGKAASPSSVIYQTGLPGKPTSWHLIEAEFRQRFEAGNRSATITEWARVLVARRASFCAVSYRENR